MPFGSKRIRALRFMLAGVVLLAAFVPAVVLGPYVLRTEHFKANPGAGYHADFYLYVSPGAKKAAEAGNTVTLLVQPNNSGITSDDPEVHRKDAWWTCFGRSGVADRLGVVLIVPAFLRPAEDWKIYTHALDRDVLTTSRPDLARLDLQLLAMVDQARTALAAAGMVVEEKFLIQGFSASGMFANRFAVLHPRRVMAVSAGSPGGWPIAPLARFEGEVLAYPAGVGDLESLTGDPFDERSYRELPQLIIMGSLDDNDSVDFRDGWDEAPAAQIDRLFGDDPVSRWDDARSLYQAAGANARFVLVEGIGHDRRALQHHTTAFFLDVLSRRRQGPGS